MSPYFTPETEASNGFTSEEIALMNARYDDLIEDIEIVDEATGQTEESRSEEIEALIGDIRDEMDAATDEEKALLYYLNNEENEDEWFDGLNDTARPFYGAGAVVEQGHCEYAVIPFDDIEDVFKEYMTELIDEVDIPRIPEDLRRYFDYDARIKDCESDGYGQMASYDGNENEVTFNDKTWIILRLN